MKCENKDCKFESDNINKFVQVIEDDEVNPKHKWFCKKCKGIGIELEGSKETETIETGLGVEVKCNETGEVIGYMPKGFE